ncbi:MAG: hypothetical protein L3J47_02700 [Sulfurovum sp.]|nr:hypothetical protein [Sulfurovum sp.]
MTSHYKNKMEYAMILKISLTAFVLGGVLFAQLTIAETKMHSLDKKNISYGKVLEKEEAMGYNYLKVDENGTTRWIAIAKAPVKVGDMIGYDTKTVMKDFKSKSLGKIFKEIIFANEVYLPTRSKAAGSMKAALSDKIASVAEMGNIQDFEPKPFYTVEEVHRFRKQLNGKIVTVKAKVYKVSKQIMKRDWVHLGDGTGNEQKLTDDLVFTASHANVKAGDEVVAKAKIVVDKDFGYGYFYKVMGEKATFKER